MWYPSQVQDLRYIADRAPVPECCLVKQYWSPLIVLLLFHISLWRFFIADTILWLHIDLMGSSFWFYEIVLHAISCQMPVRHAKRQLCNHDMIMFLTILCICSIVARLHRKSNWLLGIIFCISIITKNLGTRNFSNNFDRTGSKLIGLYHSANSAELHGFWIIMICSTFH